MEDWSKDREYESDFDKAVKKLSESGLKKLKDKQDSKKK